METRDTPGTLQGQSKDIPAHEANILRIHKFWQVSKASNARPVGDNIFNMRSFWQASKVDAPIQIEHLKIETRDTPETFHGHSKDTPAHEAYILRNRTFWQITKASDARLLGDNTVSYTHLTLPTTPYV